ncbi:MAG TPA: portal protein, partial [Alphaproteobacteria bacterium]|nr:portal protein [Alphaproteobacteria bacterium]
MMDSKKMDVPEIIVGRFDAARARRSNWEGLWQDCYDYALPYRGDFSGYFSGGSRRGETLFDATAPDAVDQLASL